MRKILDLRAKVLVFMFFSEKRDREGNREEYEYTNK
jgi:hypothetical protein